MVVKAKPVEKLTMTAAATAVKEITLTFNKAVADTTVGKITVKKGNATPTFTAKWADDKKSVVLAMDSKLTKGTYDVTVSGLEKEDLTASVTVEDQKLTAFQLLSTNLIGNDLPATYGSIKFKAVDQYGNAMKTDNVTVTSSFGKAGTIKNGKFEALSQGKFTTVKAETTSVSFDFSSTPTLGIVGTKGTVTIVGSNGVILTSELTVVAPAQASKVECVGLIDKNSKIADMTAGDTISDYSIALRFTDQYGTEMSFSEVQNISATVAGGTTAVSGVDKAVEKTVNDKKVYALPLVAAKDAAKNDLKAAAGTIQVTLVNTKYGLLDNLSFTVAPGTVIKSFSVSADNEIYNDAETTLSYTAIDADGNEVTKYDVLRKALCNEKGELDKIAGGKVELKKQADGTAKLVLKANQYVFTNLNDNKESVSDVLLFALYSGKSDTLVCNTPIKVNEGRVFWEVTGINDGVVTAGIEGAELKVKAESFKIADQYGNTLSKDDVNRLIEDKKTTLEVSVKENKGKFKTVGLTDGKAIIDAKATSFGAIIGKSDSIKLNVKSRDNSNDDGCDLELSYANALKATDFAIKWNDGVTGTFCTSNGAIDSTTMSKKFTVTGKVNGKTVTISKENYEITALTGNGKLGEITSTNPEKTVDGKLTVTVRTTDSNEKSIATDVTIDFKASNANAKLTTIKANSADLTAITGGMKVADLAKAFDLKDQYGNTISPDGVEARVDILSDNKAADVEYNGKTSCTVKGLKTGDKISITLTKGDLTATREVTLK